MTARAEGKFVQAKASDPTPQLDREHGDEAATAHPWRMVGVLSFLSFVSLLDRQIFALAAELIKADLRLSDFQLGMMQGLAFAVSFSLFALPIGALVDRCARRWILFAGVLFWGAATVGTGLARTVYEMFAARLALGAGEATVNPCSYTMIADVFPRDKLTVPMSVFSIAQIAGAALSLIAGGALIGWLAQMPSSVTPGQGFAVWRLMFLYASVPAFIGAALIFLVSEPKRRGKPAIKAVTASARAATTDWGILARHMAGFTAVQLMMATVGFWNLPYLARAFGLPPVQIGLIYGTLQLLTMLPGNLIASRLIDRLYRRVGPSVHFKWFGIASLCAVPAAIGSYLVDSLVSYLALTAIYLAVLAAYPAAAAASLQIHAPAHRRGWITAIYGMISTVVGFGLGPMLVGFLNTEVFGDRGHLGQSLAIVSGAGLAFASAILLSAGRMSAARLPPPTDSITLK